MIFNDCSSTPIPIPGVIQGSLLGEQNIEKTFVYCTLMIFMKKKKMVLK